MDLTEKEEKARKMLCLPLDVESVSDARCLVRELRDFVGLYKIGSELFTNAAKEDANVVAAVQEMGGDVFLDLKYHDIPKTVRKAAKAAARLGVYMFNVHASGGTAMMRAAVEGAREGAAEYKVRVPKVIGVTVLTSIDEVTMNEELRVPGRVDMHVLHLTPLVMSSGLDGIVCSAKDLPLIMPYAGSNYIYVTPGIEGISTRAGSDQKRVATPGEAVRNGSSLLVVGRAILDAPDRQAAAYEILQDMAKYL